MFVSGPWPVRVGRAGQEADGGEVGGGGGGVGLRGEAARRSGAASEVAVWACGVAAAARAAATAPGLRLFILGALGGVAGVWEARESGVWCMRFSAEQRERMHTSGLLGAGGGGAAGAGAGAAGWAKLGAGAEAGRSHIQAVQTSCARRQRCTFAILQASCCRRSSACPRLSACFAARAALRRVRAFAARLPPACSERGSRLDLGEPSCFAAGRRRARDEAGYTLTVPSALTRNPRLRGMRASRRSTAISCLSAGTSPSMVPRIAAPSSCNRLFRCFPTVTATVAVFVLFVGVVCRFCDPARGVRARAKLQSSDSVTLAWSTRHARTLGPCRSLWYAKPQRPSHGKRRLAVGKSGHAKASQGKPGQAKA